MVSGSRFLLAGGLPVLGRVPTEGGETGRGAAVKPVNGARRKEVLEGAGGGMIDEEL